MSPDRIPPDLIAAALSLVPPGAWSFPSTYAQTDVHHGYRRVVLVNDGLPTGPAGFGFILDRFAPVHEAWLSWIDPGGFIVSHTDAGPYRERWQVPLRPSGRWGEETIHRIGEPFQVSHWEPHSVTNDGLGPRIHLVVDRDVIVNPSTAPFTKETHG